MTSRTRRALSTLTAWALAAPLALTLSHAALATPAWPTPAPCPSETPARMSCVPGGPFLRGSNQGPAHARPQAEVWVESFLIDQHEVTVEEYKACVRAGSCPKAGPQYADFSRPRQPINGVSWFDARAYCAAQGKRLPTEAEWEKAARGVDGRTYPWGEEEADCTRAVIQTAAGRSCGVKKRGQHPEKGRVWEIGQMPPTQFGLYDMAGNSYEWVADWYSESYAACGEACAGVNPKGPCAGAERCEGHHERVVRGGSWYWPAERATTFYRRPHFPQNRPFHHFGFRCAQDLQPTTPSR